MASTNLGPDHNLAKRLSNLEDAVQRLQNADVLQNASIGAGGLTVNGGSITITGGGSLNVTGGGQMNISGGLNSGGTLSAQQSITAGTTISAGSDITTQGNLNAPNGSLSLGGNASVNGSATVGSLSSSGGGSFGGGLTATSVGLGSSGTVTSTYARNNSVSSSYVAAYLNGDGRLLASASSHTIKQDFTPADVRPLVDALYRLALIRFRYIAAVEEHGDDAAEELGSIVEYVDRTPLREFVARRTNDDGDEVPFAINWERFTIPLVAAVQDLDRRLRAAGL
ncbi:hypothetical protein LQK89_02775 [Curtobacterium sp. C1]|uniref:hypothetical protein n=1 Tax=Curtobacterium sp. C1 TaxID=2898151 RepID=UPI001E3124D1|nr:hypothetical protein [Curtobacterium sp. C1]UFU14643.1 hypothetical protein LQK89_02775 [Curtobacterium sp. C1]